MKAFDFWIVNAEVGSVVWNDSVLYMIENLVQAIYLAIKETVKYWQHWLMEKEFT